VKIAVFGLGYVGTVTAACLAEAGHSILGIDVDADKLERLRRGESSITEAGLDELVRKGVLGGAIQVTADSLRAVLDTDLAIICVGTPSRPDDSLDTTSLRSVATQIGTALKNHPRRYLIVIRSTVLPGSISGLLLPILEAESGKKADLDFDICLNPEFMREGSSIRDFYNPPITVFGVRRPEVANQVEELYGSPPSPRFVTSIEVAEMIKCTSNAFHALKIAFANEIGALCKMMNVDGKEVMEILCADKKLNISSAYLKPGSAFGGSCLPKDLRAMEYLARHRGCDTPLIRSILPSNRIHIDRTVQLVLDAGLQPVGLFGLSFKPGSDDLRESPLVAIARSLLDRGVDLAIFDDDVNLEKIIGANRRFVLQQIPNLEQLMVPTPEALLDHSALVILGKKIPGSLECLRKIKTDCPFIVDLIGVRDYGLPEEEYSGLCW